MRLPRYQSGSSLSEYLDYLARTLEQALDERPVKSPVDNVLYLGFDQPVSIISPTGKVYTLNVDDTGALITQEATL